MADTRFCIEYAKRGTAGCKKCKQKVEKGVLRIGKVVPNPFSDSGGDMKQWFHVDCIFEQLSRARATTKKIDDAGDLEGWADVQPDDRKLVLKHIDDLSSKTSSSTPKKRTSATPKKASPAKKQKLDLIAPDTTTPDTINPQKTSPVQTGSNADISVQDLDVPPSQGASKDDAFKEFRRLCASISDESTYTGKTSLVAKFFKGGTTGKGFTGDLYLWTKFLLPMVNKRVYNLQSKQLVKLFSRIFGGGCLDEMIEDLEQGDVAETVRIFFEQHGTPSSKSKLTLQQVDAYLERLSKLTREDDQEELLRNLSARCTGNDLKMIVRLIKHDIRINSGPKHILEALHPDAYQAFQASRNLEEVVRTSKEGKVSVSASLMTPMIPMLAEACGSADAAFARCPNGMYAEIKYDGERVQLHKKGAEFLFFSRSLKPVSAHKVQHLKEFIPRAFPHGNDIVLDSEILLVDTQTGKPLPFGTLGIHKKAAFQAASVCLFVFDCLHYNGKSLLDSPLRKRREILQANMTPIENHVVFSEKHVIANRTQLQELIADVLSQGLEGLVLKDPDGIYEPGKRRWLKVKKDYLEGGSMADSADLVVLGAYFGTGSKGGIMSIFLMGCWNPATGRWCTVTKVHGGHDDATLERLQTELDMVKISKQAERVPSWLNVHKVLVPDFVARDPDTSQVWEISGAEFTRAEVHTADGISIRFPRVTRIRTDKTPKEATTLLELRKLFKASKETPFEAGKKTAAPDCEPQDDEKAAGQSTSRTPSPRKGKKSLTQTPGTSNQQTSSLQEKQSLAQSAQNSPGSSNNLFTSPRTGHKLCNFPDVFTGIRMCLPEDRLLKRYFVAYDGELCESDVDMPTHILSKRPSAKTKAKHVSLAWLWDSIKLQKRQDEAKYMS